MRHTSALRLVAGLPLAALVLVSCATGSQPTAVPTAPVRELINPGDSLAEASRFGDLVFTAGFLGDASGDDFTADVDDALNRLEAALGASGAGFDTLLKVNVYLTDWDNWETFDTIYRGRIGKYGTPPRTTVEIVRLGFDAPIEIAAIAHVRASSP
jgi:2-iminobutanoate/2-iminopropanoate deaminase